MKIPLAEKIRPTKIEEIIGQTHLLGKQSIFNKMLRSKVIPNMILYGPPGVGKTTVANIIAKSTDRKLYKLNATSASLADIKAITEKLNDLMHFEGVLLYLDEIQNFNKKQQQALLEYLENGKITLIASTTENPYFYVYKAILSRSVIFEFKAIAAEDIKKALNRAITLLEADYGKKIQVERECLEELSKMGSGDVRQSLNLLELMVDLQKNEAECKLSLDYLHALGHKKVIAHDIKGDEHYNVLSAFQKSIRGSDVDASLHYLARLVQAGDLQSITRRLLVMASEDIGLAYPQAITIVKACVDSAFQLGFPEAKLPLSQAVILLATAPKSNSCCEAIESALSDLQTQEIGLIPSYLQDGHYSGAEKLGKAIGYQYPHSFPNSYIKQTYLPSGLENRVYYHGKENKFERGIRNYWADIKKEQKE